MGYFALTTSYFVLSYRTSKSSLLKEGQYESGLITMITILNIWPTVLIIFTPSGYLLEDRGKRVLKEKFFRIEEGKPLLVLKIDGAVREASHPHLRVCTWLTIVHLPEGSYCCLRRFKFLILLVGRAYSP